VFVIALAAVVSRTRPSAATVAGLVLATGGAALLTDSGSAHASISGDIYVLVGIISSAGYVVFVQPLAETMNALDLTAAQFVYGGVMTIPAVALLSAGGALTPFNWAPTRFVLGAIGIGVVGSTIAFALYNWALSRVRPSVSGVSLTLIPVFGLTFSIVFLGDDVTSRLGIAAALVVVGLVVTSTSQPAEVAHSPGV
jgi:drug/metabolite transporter (DMT)-like permease